MLRGMSVVSCPLSVAGKSTRRLLAGCGFVFAGVGPLAAELVDRLRQRNFGDFKAY